ADARCHLRVTRGDQRAVHAIALDLPERDARPIGRDIADSVRRRTAARVLVPAVDQGEIAALAAHLIVRQPVGQRRDRFHVEQRVAEQMVTNPQRTVREHVAERDSIDVEEGRHSSIPLLVNWVESVATGRTSALAHRTSGTTRARYRSGVNKRRARTYTATP